VNRRFVWPALAWLVVMLVATSPAAAAPAYRIDLYFASGYERQVDGRTCVAASAKMMLNFIARRDIRLSQYTILRYAQRNDALNDQRQLGSDPLGWARAVTRYSTQINRRTSYQWASYRSKTAALKAAALAIAQTRKPVGLLVWNGRHAVVMTGFVASRDPRLGSFTLQSVFISDPYRGGPIATTHGRWTPSRLPFGRYLELDATRTYDRAWYGRWVVVKPVVADPQPPPPPPPSPSPTPTPSPTPEPTPEPDASAAPSPDASPASTEAPETTATPQP
jgi:hypothetical protein